MMIRWAETCHCGEPILWLHELPEDWEAYLRKNGHTAPTLSIRVELTNLTPTDTRYDPDRHTLHYPRCGVNPKAQSLKGRKPRGL